MLTNINIYAPKTDWEKNCKVDLNIRDLQEKYAAGCMCCGNFYARKDYSKLINSHFKTKKHKTKCLEVANENFIKDFRNFITMNFRFYPFFICSSLNF